MRATVNKIIAVSILLLLALAALVFGVGCAAEAKSIHRSERTVVLYPDGKVESETRINAAAKSLAPGPTSQPTTADALPTGSMAAASGRQEKPLAAYGAEQRAWIFGGGGSLCLVGAAVAWSMRQKMLAASLGAAAGVLFVAPRVVDIAAPYLAAGVVLIVLLGVVWAIARAVAGRSQNLSAAQSADKLAREGKFHEAFAAFRESEIAKSAAKKVKAS